MTDNPQPLHVVWVNDHADAFMDQRQAAWKDLGVEVHRLNSLLAADDEAPLRVLPVWAYALPRLRIEVLSDERPTLFLVQDAHQVESVLSFARDRDELARADESVAALARRMQRLARRSARFQLLAEGAERDPLTRLLNRQAFDTELRRAADAERAGEAVYGLLLLDVDHFKQVNDVHGHTTGDQVLRRLAATLRQHSLPGDRVARIGGEEMVVLLQRPGLADIQGQAEALRQHIAHLVFPGLPETLQVTASIGTALLEPGLSAADWLGRADMAAYAAKAAGRNRVVSFESLRDSSDSDSSLMVQHFDSVTRVVTERVATLVSNMGRQMLRTVQREAEVDALTGVPNRRVFDQRIARELGRAGRETRPDAIPVAVLLLDIDHFGRFNREHGVPTGDAVLRQFAQNLATAIRPKDWLARYGGEEFCVVMHEALPDAVAAAERLCEQVAATPLRGQHGQVLHITVSIGVACSLGAEEDTDALLMRASSALQRAKQQGRNRVRAAG